MATSAERDPNGVWILVKGQISNRQQAVVLAHEDKTGISDEEREQEERDASAQKALEEYHRQLVMLEEMNRRKNRLAKMQQPRRLRVQHETEPDSPLRERVGADREDIGTLEEYKQHLMREAQRHTRELER